MIGNRDDSEPGRPAHAPDERELTPQTVWDLLADSLRRRTLRALDADEGRVALADLAERVADERPVDAVAVQLHHNHLPKLAAYGLATYDADANEVVAESVPEWVEPFLDA
ncbi:MULTISPECIES: hypothetical protein [Halorussus]|uniref:DUF7344 domain-containing protein n=1 Tax=Halorussus TaxID=1070314 RepID=UPI000E217A68|nr:MULTISPECIES: hypothetical protein [Halorussus]NHN58881.1 hypothetical protein [Halorussus sp. JP-T4]